MKKKKLTLECNGRILRKHHHSKLGILDSHTCTPRWSNTAPRYSYPKGHHHLEQKKDKNIKQNKINNSLPKRFSPTPPVASPPSCAYLAARHSPANR